MDKILAVTAMLLTALNDVIYSRVAVKNDSINKYVFYAIQALAAFLVSIIIMLATKIRVMTDIKSILFGSGIGLISFVTYFTILKCLEYGNASKSITIFRLNFIISSMLAVAFLGESITAKKVISTTLCILAIVLFSNADKQLAIRNGIRLSIVACFFGGVINFINKVALINGVDSLNIIFYRYLVVFLLAFILLLRKSKETEISKNIPAVGIISGIIISVELYIAYIALKFGDVTVIIPIIQLSFVFSSAVLFILLKEKMSLMKVLGLCFAIASIIIVI